MDPNRFHYYSNSHMVPYQKMAPNVRSINSSETGSTTKRTGVWEPYAISPPRKAVTTDELIKDQSTKVFDEDWLHAYATYSPYRTTNQTYGAQKPNMNLSPNVYPNQTSGYSQVPGDPRQNAMNMNAGGRGPVPSSTLNIFSGKGLPPLAYATLKSTQPTE